MTRMPVGRSFCKILDQTKQANMICNSQDHGLFVNLLCPKPSSNRPVGYFCCACQTWLSCQENKLEPMGLTQPETPRWEARCLANALTCTQMINERRPPLDPGAGLRSQRLHQKKNQQTKTKKKTVGTKTRKPVEPCFQRRLLFWVTETGAPSCDTGDPTLGAQPSSSMSATRRRRCGTLLGCG